MIECFNHYSQKEIFEKQFLVKLHLLKFNDKILSLLIRALKESHKEEKVFHNECIKRPSLYISLQKLPVISVKKLPVEIKKMEGKSEIRKITNLS